MTTEESAAILPTGATATVACITWLRTRNFLLTKYSIPEAEAWPAKASFKFGKCRFEQFHFAADVPAAIAGCRFKQFLLS